MPRYVLQLCAISYQMGAALGETRIDDDLVESAARELSLAEDEPEGDAAAVSANERRAAPKRRLITFADIAAPPDGAQRRRPALRRTGDPCGRVGAGDVRAPGELIEASGGFCGYTRYRQHPKQVYPIRGYLNRGG